MPHFRRVSVVPHAALRDSVVPRQIAGRRTGGRHPVAGMGSGRPGLPLLLAVAAVMWTVATAQQDPRGAGAGTLSSLVRALELSEQESSQAVPSRSLPPPISRNQPPPVSTSASRSFLPSTQSRFSPAVQSTRESPANTRREAPPPPSKSPRFEAKSISETSGSSRPVATANTEFRFGSIRRDSPRPFLPPLDRSERVNRPLLPHQVAAVAFANPSKAGKEPKPTEFVNPSKGDKEPKTAEIVDKLDNSPSSPKTPNETEYSYDEYYDDYYYYEDKSQGNDQEKKGNQPEDLGPIDPPMTKGHPEQPATSDTTRKQITTESVQRTTPVSRPTKSSGRPSLSEILAARKENKEIKTDQRTSNELQTDGDGWLPSENSESIDLTTIATPPETTTQSRVEVRVTNTTESTSVVSNVQTSRSVSIRQEGIADLVTPATEIEFEEEKNSNRNAKQLDDPPRPSLTALFENINISFSNDNETPEQTTARSKASSTPTVVDITTEAERFSTTEKIDLSALLDSIFEKPKPLDSSKLPANFVTSEDSIAAEPEVKKSSTLSKLLESAITSSTTPKAEHNLVDHVSELSNQDITDDMDTTEATSNTSAAPLKEDLLFAAIFGKAKPETAPSSLLPPGFKGDDSGDQLSALPKFNVPVGKSDGVPAHLLPKGFNVPVGVKNASASDEQSSNKSITLSESSSADDSSKGPKGLVFPKRVSRPSFLTTSERTTTEYVEPSGPEPLKPTIVNIFDRIKSPPKHVAFTPTKPPKKFEELQVEVTSSATNSASSSTTTSTTTTTTTTTTVPPRPTTPGVCGQKCRLAGTLRIVAGAEWVPELANRDTKEWQSLAKSVTNELNAVYQRSRLSRWFMGVEVDAFNPGSILVDYFLQLNDVTAGLDTIDLKQMINGMLENSNRAEYNLGPLTVDPEGTDFVVLKERLRSVVRDDGSYLIPEWLIAVIVISLASFLFIIIFGIAVLVSRARARVRCRNMPLTEEVLNKLNASQLAAADNYAHDNMYDIEAIWNDKLASERNMKPPSSRGRGYNPNYNINIYDSWRTDWSGPYGSSATYAKRRPEANF